MTRAAESGHIEAQHQLGHLYENGTGVEKNTAKAFEWWLKAATQKHAAAQHNVGVAYEKGEGVPQDIGAAAEWMRDMAARA